MNGIFPDKPSWTINTPLYFNYNSNELNNINEEIKTEKRNEKNLRG